MSLLKEMRTIARDVMTEPDAAIALARISVRGKFSSRLVYSNGLIAARSIHKTGPLASGPVEAAASGLRRK